MPNKKINQLDVRTGVALTDLLLIGDPTSGTSYKLTGTDFKTLLNLVPYTGATGDVNLGEFQLRAGQLTLDTSPTGTAAVGTTRWNDTIGSSETTLKGGSVILKNGVDLVARVVNKVSPNTTLTKAAYQAVRVSGAQGQRLAVAFAQANNDANSADTIGLVTETIATNQEGFIITVGQLENINTTGSLQGETWVDGDVLYLSPFTPGAITKVKPTGNGHIVVIGYVEYAHANNGKIYVKVMNGWELTELHDCDIVTPANNEALIYESSTSLWKNKTIASALGYTPISGSGATGQVAYWNGANSQTGSNNLFWDAANARLGIGTNAPDNTFVVNTAVSAGGILLKQNSTTIGEFTRVGNNNRSRINLINSGVTEITFDSGGLSFIRSNNFVLGSTGDNGQRLQVYGDAFIKGSGATSATSALLVQNSGSSLLLSVTNNGTTTIRGTTAFDGDNALNVINNANTSIFNIWNSGYVFVNRLGGTARFQVGSLTIEETSTIANFGLRPTTNFTTSSAFSGYSVNFTNPQSITSTGGETFHVNITATLAPTSGGTPYTSLRLNPTINQTGGANGITRGLYVNPTLTAAADWRSIEWSNNSGWGLYGAGTSNNYLGGRLLIKTSTVGIYDLDVNGTARVRDEIAIIKNASATTRLTLTNTTSAANEQVLILFTSDSNSGSATIGKYSTGTTVYKTIAAKDSYWYNGTVGGDISILNDFTSGTIKMAAGGSSTAQFTIKSNGRINMSSLPTSSAGLSAGDLWNNLGILSIA